MGMLRYRQTSNISITLVGDKIVDLSDVVEESRVSSAPAISSSQINTRNQWIGQRKVQDETRNIQVLGFGAAYIRGLTVIYIFSVV